MVASKIRPQLPDLARGFPDSLAAFASVFNRLAAFVKSASSELGVGLPERRRAEALLTVGTEAVPSTSPPGTFEASDRLLPESVVTFSGLAFSSSSLEASMCSPT